MEKNYHAQKFYHGNQIESKNVTEKGNVLFLIFIGIVLFAALGFAVSDMLRSGDPTVVLDEKAKVTAAEIIDVARGLRQAAQNVKISGCTEEDVSFTVTGADGYQHAPVSPNSCRIFHPSGGGLSALTTTPEGQSWVFSGSAQFNGIGDSCGAASCAELFVYVPVLSDAVCDSINEQLGLAADIDGDSFPAALIAAAPRFTGTYAATYTIGNNTVAPEMLGRMTGCIDQTATASGQQVFVQALLAR